MYNQGYNKELDKKLAQKYLTFDSQDRGIVCQIYQYNGGELKVQFARFYKDKQGNTKFTKLGRMRFKEVNAIFHFVNEYKGNNQNVDFQQSEPLKQSIPDNDVPF